MYLSILSLANWRPKTSIILTISGFIESSGTFIKSSVRMKP